MNTSFTIIMPVRIESEERLKNLESTLHWIDCHGGNVIVLEADKKRHLLNLEKSYKGIKYLFVRDENEIFHRTRYINTLLHHTQTDYVAVWDADIIIPFEQIWNALEIIQSQQYTIVYPYDGTVIMLSPEQTETFRRHFDLEQIDRLKLTPLLGRRSCGGLHIVNRAKYISIGGENEKYIGWGPEDAERLRRTIIMGHGVCWLPYGTLYHLHHTRQMKQQAASNPLLIQMRREFVRECSMNKEEMQNYIQTEM